MAEDITIKCSCGKVFVWTRGEQEFMEDLLERGKIEEIYSPKRCPDCRRKKKEKYNK